MTTLTKNQAAALERHPHLSDMLNLLHAHMISPSGLSQNLHQRLTQARHVLNHKQVYLENKAIYDPLERLRFLSPSSRTPLQTQVSIHVDRIISLLETRRLLVDKYKDNSTAQDWKNSLHAMTRILSSSSSVDDQHEHERGNDYEYEHGHGHDNNQEDIASHLDPEKDLNRFTLDQLKPHLEALEGIQGPLLETIQQSILDKETTVLDNYKTAFHPNGLFASISSLAGTQPATNLNDVITRIREQQDVILQAKEAAAVQQRQLLQRVNTLFELLQQSIAILWQIVVEFKIKQRHVQDSVFHEYHAQLVESLILRMKLLKASMTNAIYDTETIQALTTARDTLHQHQVALEQKTRENTILLQKFQEAGSDFEAIVKAYANIIDRINTVQDDIQRLQH
ncbi:hypothetical protein BGZ94_007405 [Podila epigama]|nr:hypothetical protein BGZ94_007405 [Podila epigama]